MIVFRERTIFSLFEEMENSPIKFYLTGSHYFRNWTEMSDFDFYIESKEINHDELTRMGFKAIMMEVGRNIKQIWGHRGLLIHIQEVIDLQLQHRVIQFVQNDSEMLVALRDKQKRSEVWEQIWEKMT